MQNQKAREGEMKKMAWASATALAAALLASLTPSASEASVAATEVRNTSTISIGAVQYRDGQYKHHPYYDDLIPPGRLSGYPSTAGVYIGPGYCVRLRYWLRGTEQNPPSPPDLSDPEVRRFPTGGWVWFLSRSWDVRALPLSDPGCQGPAPSAEDGPFFTVSGGG
ncbi:hypothetical protein [Planobispora rosea]|nr:hypothetical protein [Planobispora rosea]